MDNAPIILTDIEQAERDAHQAVSRAIANADGLNAADMQARIVGIEHGLSGDDSATINAKLGE